MVGRLECCPLRMKNCRRRLSGKVCKLEEGTAVDSRDTYYEHAGNFFERADDLAVLTMSLMGSLGFGALFL